MPASPAPRRGSAAVLLLAALLVLGGLVAWLVLAGTQATPGPGDPVTPRADAGVQETRTDRSIPTVRTNATTPAGAPAAGPARTAGGPRRVGGDPDRFRGRGVLRGSIEAAPGLSMPAAWTLVLEPSSSLAGSGDPEPRRIELTGDDDWVVEDLPLGGYAVRAEAPGCNGRAVHVLLERTSNAAYVMLQLSPAGFVEGRLVDADGAPVEEVEVWLLPGAPKALGLTGSEGRSTRSDVEGLWRFDDVLDGTYTLLFGPPSAPLVDPVAIRFQAPSLTWPSPELPPLVDLELLVTDAVGQPVGDATVVGTSPQAFRATSLPNGSVRVPNLPFGFLNVRAEHEALGSGRLTLQLVDPDGDGTAGPHVIGLAEFR